MILLDAGVPPEHLRLFYVHVTRPSGRVDPDMVLAYFPRGLGQDPLILDARPEEPAHASQRQDLKPLFMFTLDRALADRPVHAVSHAGTQPRRMDNKEIFVRKAIAEGYRLPVKGSR